MRAKTEKLNFSPGPLRDFMQQITSLGESLEGCEMSNFCELAYKELKSAKIRCDGVKLDELIGLLDVKDLNIPLEFNDRGMIPVRLYSSKNFVIRIHIWRDGDASVHSHPFMGAAQVLKGKSVEQVYYFDKKVGGYDNIIVEGTRSNGPIITHEEGSVFKLPFGDAHIHSLTHLKEPTITLMVVTDFVFREFSNFYPNFKVNRENYLKISEQEAMELEKKVLQNKEELKEREFLDLLLFYLGKLMSTEERKQSLSRLDHYEDRFPWYKKFCEEIITAEYRYRKFHYFKSISRL